MVWISEPARAQEAFLVRIENRHQRNLRQIQALAQQVDADQHVELAAPQIAQDLDAVERAHFRMQIAAVHADLGIIFGQILGHALGQRGHQHALIRLRALADLAQQVVHLALDRPDFDFRIDQAGRPDDLLHHHARRLGQLVRARRRRDVDHLVDAMLELLERQRTVVERAGQAESVRHQHLLARAVAVIHAVKLRDGLVALVEKHDGSRAADNRAASAALRPAGVRKNAASSSRCRGSSRSLSSFRDRTWCAGTAAAPRSACPASPVADATTPAPPGCEAMAASRFVSCDIT